MSLMWCDCMDIIGWSTTWIRWMFIYWKWWIILAWYWHTLTISLRRQSSYILFGWPFIDISKSSSGRYLFVQSGGKVTSESSYVDLADSSSKPVMIQPRRHNILYDTYHVGNQLWIVTNEDALNFKLMYTSIDKPSVDNWKPLIPYDPEVILTWISAATSVSYGIQPSALVASDGQ